MGVAAPPLSLTHCKTSPPHTKTHPHTHQLVEQVGRVLALPCQRGGVHQLLHDGAAHGAAVLLEHADYRTVPHQEQVHLRRQQASRVGGEILGRVRRANSASASQVYESLGIRCDTVFPCCSFPWHPVAPSVCPFASFSSQARDTSLANAL